MRPSTGMDVVAAFKDFEASGWTHQARTYDELTGAMSVRVVDDLLDAAGVRPGMRVLDVATGPGHVAAAALRRGAGPLGIDLSEGMLALARERHPAIEFLQADAENLPFSDSSFEAVAGNFVLNHLPRPKRALAELRRVLAPGGRLALSVWDRPERNPSMGVVADAVVRAGASQPPSVPEGPDGFRFADDREFERLVRGAGLAEVGVRTVAFEHEVSGPAELWRGFFGSSVRTKARVEAQPDAVRRRIRELFDGNCERWRRDGRLVLPVSVKIGSGARP